MVQHYKEFAWNGCSSLFMETWALEQSSCVAKTLSKLGVPPKVEVHGLLGYNLLFADCMKWKKISKKHFFKKT